MPSWKELNLGGSQLTVSRLPVSRFPDWAEIYFCDNCGADLTRFVRWVSGHAARPIGPENRTCVCGRTFKTGCTEWDHLSPREQKRHSGRFLMLLLPAFCAIVGVPVAVLSFALLGNWKTGFFASILAGVLWALYTNFSFWATVAASRRRTRGKLS